MTEKIPYALLISICLIVGVLVAGCSSQAPVTTPVPTTTAPQAKYVAGDIVAKSSDTTDKSLYMILGYDPVSDEYSRAWIYKNADGSWGHRIDDSTSKTTRTIIEKTYPVKIAHVSVAGILIVTPTIPTAVPTTYSGSCSNRPERHSFDRWGWNNGNADYHRQQLPERCLSKTHPWWRGDGYRNRTVGFVFKHHGNIQSLRARRGTI